MKTKPSPLADRATVPAAGNAAAPAERLANNPIWNQPALKQEWPVGNLSTSDELKMGADLHDLILQLNPVVKSGPWLSRVDDAAQPLLSTLKRKDITYKFTILDSDEVNAFSHPGGYVYVSRGLFGLIGEDEDYALQFAVGHEIAHVDLQHAIRCLQDPDVRKMPEGTLKKLYCLIIPFGYLVTDRSIRNTKRTSGCLAACERWAARSAKPSLSCTNSMGTPRSTASRTARPTCVSAAACLYSTTTTEGRPPLGGRLKHLKEAIK